jgi:hypothetical protein
MNRSSEEQALYEFPAYDNVWVTSLIIETPAEKTTHCKQTQFHSKKIQNSSPNYQILNLILKNNSRSNKLLVNKSYFLGNDFKMCFCMF